MENDQEIICDSCSVKFNNELDFQEHNLNNHATPQENFDDADEVSTQVDIIFEDSPLIFCDICKQNVEIDQFNNHEVCHYNENCSDLAMQW